MEEEIDVLDELWQIKQELSSKFATFREYCADLLKYQSEKHPEFSKDQIVAASAV